MNAIEFVKQHNNDFREGYKTAVLSLHDVEQLLIKWDEQKNCKIDKTKSQRTKFDNRRKFKKQVQVF